MTESNKEKNSEANTTAIGKIDVKKVPADDTNLSSSLKREELFGKIQAFFSPGKSNSDNKHKIHHTEEKKDVFQEETKETENEREKLINFLKAKKNYLQYIVLAVIIWFGSFIRTRNLNLLKDTTTGDYIPLALDPHLFTRYANYIIEHGKLFAYDLGRFTPEGISTIKYWMTSYFIAYLYKFISIFSDVSVNYAVVIYPVVCFAVALVFFFLLSKRLFDWRIALLATGFLAIVPSFLYRTMAGFADHEALGVMFMFMATYFYICGWQTKNTKQTILFGVLAGLTTGLMGVTWGGWKFLLLMISGFTLVEFFLEKTKRQDLYQYLSWTISFVIITTLIIPQYTFGELLGSFTTAIVFMVLFILAFHELLSLDKFKVVYEKFPIRLPKSLITTLFVIVLGIFVTFTVVGVDSIVEHGAEIANGILHPLGNNRWELTVAEQHQPYFTEWVSNYGPQLFSSIPLYLVLFMTGSVLLFFTAVEKTKFKWQLTGVYIAFLLAFTMSRYSASAKTFNGINGISIATYIGSLVAFAAILAGVFLYGFYKDRNLYEQILSIDKKYIFILIWFLIMIVAARGAIRLFFIFTPINALLAGYGTFNLFDRLKTVSNKAIQITGLVLLLFVLLSPLAYPMKGIIPAFSSQTLGQASYTSPGYNYQWQVAGEWVRNNISEDAVFAHWWDYGYWVQTGWERDTVLDGTNKITYWNYLMGRHVMCGQDETEALEFLKVHEATHFLIVSDEIGKYTAYSSIGSDEDYDRFSWITTFAYDQSLMYETRNSTVIGYRGGYVLDDNFVYNDIVFPRQSAGIGGVYVPLVMNEEKTGIEQINEPYVIMTNGVSQEEVPLSCVYINNQFYFFDHGAEDRYNGCFAVIPQINGDGSVANGIGAGLFVSEEGFKALWTNLYIFNGDNPYFDTSTFGLVYDQTSSYAPLSLYQGRIIGPIKIWEINYPENFTVSDELTENYLGHNELLPDYFFDVN